MGLSVPKNGAWAYGCGGCDFKTYVSSKNLVTAYEADHQCLTTIASAERGHGGKPLGKHGLERGHAPDDVRALHAGPIGYYDIWRVIITVDHERRHTNWCSNNEQAWKYFDKDEKARGDKSVVTRERVKRAVKELSECFSVLILMVPDRTEAENAVRKAGDLEREEEKERREVEKT